MGLYRDRIFPACYDLLMGMGKLESLRQDALAPVRGDILEIGIGTGLNLAHYPEPVRSIVGIDSNPGMLKQLSAKLRTSPVDVRIECAGADQLPFPDDSFDTVVSTLVLCSLPDRPAALREIQRVLRPNGRFVFLEHGLSPDPKVAAWQTRLNSIQRRFAVGCLLDVPVNQELESAGFAFEQLSMGYQKGESKTHGYLYQGIAILGTV
ncbi:class I SAM-dependent methyltransferase [Haloferula sp.]|uniref:class I SAM-dependent methyltransferase n=1 Tax=Haloferula sp. TaxID=2497595 RepID=UPI003C741605